MCGGTCGKSSKILAGVGIGLGVVGAIIYAVAHLTAAAGASIGFEMEGKMGGTLAVGGSDGLLGYEVLIKTSDFSTCATISSSLAIVDPNGDTVSGSWSCTGGNGVEDFRSSNDPPLSSLGAFGLPDGETTTNADGTQQTNRLQGNYVITSTAELWIVDTFEEFGEAVGGVFAAMGIGLIAIILIVAGAILCCISCCCMEKK